MKRKILNPIETFTVCQDQNLLRLNKVFSFNKISKPFNFSAYTGWGLEPRENV